MENFASLIRFVIETRHTCRGKTSYFPLRVYTTILWIAISIRHPWRIYIYIRICITIGKSGRRSKTRFPRWGKYFSTLGDTYLSSWEADARTDAYPNLHLQRDGEEIATRRFAVWVSVFIGGGILASGADLLLPLEPFWQRASSWGLCTMTKGMGRGKRKGRGKKKGKGRTRHVEEKSNAVRRTETNSRLEARGGGTPWRGYTGCPVNFTP